MTVFIIRRLMQAGVVVLLMSFLVFSGVFLVGDPVDILISDEADEEDICVGAERVFTTTYLTSYFIECPIAVCRSVKYSILSL